MTGTSGLAGSDSLQVSVDNAAPLVQGGPGGTALAGSPFPFHGAFSDPGTADTHTIAWDFGDGQSASGTLAPQHIYTAPGSYTARLTVTDDDGASGSATVTVQILATLEVGAGGEWSPPITTTSPCGAAFRGEFGSQTVSLALGQDSPLPPHGRVQVTFDLYIIRSWDGTYTGTAADLARKLGIPMQIAGSPNSVVGPDRWQFKAAGQSLLDTTFSNWDPQRFLWARQSFPAAFPSGDYPAQTGAAAVNDLCYTFGGFQQDSRYHLTYLIDHTAPTLTLDFSAAGLQAISDESWGLDNVSVILLGGLTRPQTYLYLPLMHAR